MMKRVIVLMLALALVFSLAACKGAAPETTTVPAATDEATTAAAPVSTPENPVIRLSLIHI